MTPSVPPTSSPLFAAIDLGSNSFHMLVVREVAGSVQVVAKVKRKVRLAAGLDENKILSKEAMQRGWHCLEMFAEQLRDIPASNLRIVGTATLRIARNVSDFLNQAEQILGHQIEIISGDDEARIIYRGVAQTSSGTGKRLIIDIGGASTELVVGQEFEAKLLTSLKMGCVIWRSLYFSDGLINEDNFKRATQAARNIIKEVASEYRRIGWQCCLGASGTIQALAEVMKAQGMDERITLNKLYELRQQSIDCGHIDTLSIKGLDPERILVFPSGLSILIALFESLQIQTIILAGGALREGLVYSMLIHHGSHSIRERTVTSLIQRHQIDHEQAQRVAECVDELADQLITSQAEALDEEARAMLVWAALLHEIGLNIEFKQAPKHAAYILDHSDMPGFTRGEKHLLSALMLNQRGKINFEILEQQNAVSVTSAQTMTRLLRIAIVICMRRRQGTVPKIILNTQQGHWQLQLPKGWQKDHALRSAELELECEFQEHYNWSLQLIEA